MEEKNLIQLIKVTIEDDKDKKNILYYDRFSKKILDVDENGIRVYDRKAKNLKDNFFVNIPKESLISISIDKELNYILCLLLNSKNKKTENEYTKKLVLINTRKLSFEKVDDNFKYLLGMFFIGKIINLKSLDINANTNNINDFCTVFCDKVIFYSIEKKTNGDEYIKKLNTINMSGNLLIINFLFDYKHKILCLVRSDLTICFLILITRKNYKNLIIQKLSYVNTLKGKPTFLGKFRRVEEEQKLMVKSNYENWDLYTQTQFYLETIYNELYLICLCYEDNKIYLHKLENLNNLDICLKIDYNKHSHFSALQVIDNLIILHNFITKIIFVIDIKSKIKILRSFKFDFPYQNNLHINGQILEEREVFHKNKLLINVYGGNLYNIKFNEKVYDELEEADLKEIRKNKKLTDKKNTMIQERKAQNNRYDILKNILNRKGTNSLILNILYRIILNNDEKPYHIIKFFKDIISLENAAKEKIEVISDKKLAKKELSEPNNSFEVPKPFNIVKDKKKYIQQIDILRSLFERFGNELKDNNNKEKKNESNKSLDDGLIMRIIFYMVQFYSEINNRKIDIKPGFYSIILNYIKMLKQKEKLIPFFVNQAIPDNEEIGKYLVEISLDKNNKNKEIFEDFGYKILYRTKSHQIIIDFLIKKGDIPRAMNYLNEISTKLKLEQINDIFIHNKDIIEKNKDLFLQYIN